MKKAIVLMSGGLDSTLCAAIANNDGYEIAGLHLNYGQLTQERELKAFEEVCNYYDVDDKLIVDIGFLTQIGGSSLTDTKMEVHKADLDAEEVPNTYVPFRNANILGIATSWAEVIGAEAIYIGAVEEDSSGYPDCRKSFFEAYQEAINLGTKPETVINIKTPIINMSKKEIVLKSKELDAPINLSWSCYTNSEEACGECDSCALRLRGFEMAGLTDPITYKK
jgi:7-cyano-7-deazaguanine synthase